MRQLSADHVAALAATALTVVVAVRGARRRGERWAVRASRTLAVLLAAAYAAEYAANALDGTWSPRFNLPLHLTDAVTLVSVAALWAPRPLLVELVYFWALTASLQAILTPDLGQGFPSLFYGTYFVTHSGAIVAACLLVAGRGLVPRRGAVARVYALTAAFAALAAAGNALTGGNYMYLRRKPGDPSLLDAMGPWPWYILAGALVGLVLFLALARLAPLLAPRPSRG